MNNDMLETIWLSLLSLNSEMDKGTRSRSFWAQARHALDALRILS